MCIASVVLSLVFCGHLGFAQECPAPQPSKPVVIHVTAAEAPAANLKSRLIRELTRSLIDQGRGIVDIPREREIQKLMKQLKEIYDLARSLRRGETHP